ncbi:hypothetical protein MLD38_007856 [Melastoma candidum]|uniref:Uncharacterized protein n=1 Tax=Melastoma candidum TaxID=119954 RepID=A0ACB9RTT1_9MYRT|nr:hypothetical protein MLD38_007856 [Melastoma candidum]
MEDGLVQCSGNYVPLTPISFLERAAFVYRERTSVVYGNIRYTWRETHKRCLRLASALFRLNISPGDRVAALAPNIPALYELHFGVPMAGAVLAAMNVMLDEPTLARLLKLLEAKLIFVDNCYTRLVSRAIDACFEESQKPLMIVIHDLCDHQSSHSSSKRNGSVDLDYESLLAMEMGDFRAVRPTDERDPISVSFTSGSTGLPKAVVYSHRSAYLNSIAAIFRYEIKEERPVFLWTVDMFRCNGWCFTWAMAAIGGTNVCLRNLTAEAIFTSIDLHGVTHLCGNPVILTIVYNSLPSERKPLPHRVQITVAGTFPPENVVEKVEELGFHVKHGYGMTELMGPAIVTPWKRKSSPKDNPQNLICENVHGMMMEGVNVIDPRTMRTVPSDGKTPGEIVFRGNTVMIGYLNDPQATREAFGTDGWFRTGDVGVISMDGQIEMKDRAEDAIILNNYGNELSDGFLSSMDVEKVLLGNPKVREAAVVGVRRGDSKVKVCAFVKLEEGVCCGEEEIKEWYKEEGLGGGGGGLSMVIDKVQFGDLPVNCTGKVQKFVLRERAADD